MVAGAPALDGANAKKSKAQAGAEAHAEAALRALARGAALDPGAAAVAAALMIKLPAVRFMRKLFLGLFGEGERRGRRRPRWPR